MRKILFFTFFACVNLSSCQNQDSTGKETRASSANKDAKAKKCLSVVNGKKTSAYASVWSILIVSEEDKYLGVCTGTFVSHNTMITASHCTPKKGAVLLTGKGSLEEVPYDAEKGEKFLKNAPRSEKILALEKSLMVEDKLDPWNITKTKAAKDLAVVIFPDNTANDFSPVAVKRAADGSEVAIVGYGKTEISFEASPSDNQGESKSLTKHFGMNKLIAKDEMTSIGMDPDKIYFILGNAKTTSSSGKKSLGAPGDSGGPMFSGKTLIGIATTAGISPEDKEQGFNMHVDLTSSSSKSFLKSAKKEGAEISYQTEDSSVQDSEENDELDSDPCS